MEPVKPAGTMLEFHPAPHLSLISLRAYDLSREVNPCDPRVSWNWFDLKPRRCAWVIMQIAAADNVWPCFLFLPDGDMRGGGGYRCWSPVIVFQGSMHAAHANTNRDRKMERWRLINNAAFSWKTLYHFLQFRMFTRALFPSAMKELEVTAREYLCVGRKKRSRKVF